MEVIPAIDLRGGLCVRLYQGDYRKETVYSADPVKVAIEWQQAGAPRLHIVDLDGARTGQSANISTVMSIASTVEIPLQVGGGIRSMEEAERLLEAGIERVVLGTAAVRDSGLVRQLCQHAGGERIVVAVDAQDGRVAIEGWQEHTSVDALELILQMADLGARRFLYTDISRDGTLTEPNFQAIGQMVKEVRLPILASGGVSSVNHVRRLARLGVEGAILGKALYTGDLGLSDAIQAGSAT